MRGGQKLAMALVWLPIINTRLGGRKELERVGLVVLGMAGKFSGCAAVLVKACSLPHNYKHFHCNGQGAAGPVAKNQ